MAKLEIDGPSNTGQIAHPSLNSRPWILIIFPVGTAPDAPQNANLPLCICNTFSVWTSSSGCICFTKWVIPNTKQIVNAT